MNSTTRALLTDWERWMRGGGMSERTIDDRVKLVGRLARATSTAPETMTWSALADFLADPRFKAGTRLTYYANLCAWYHWLVLMDIRVDDPTQKLRAPKGPRRSARPVTREQLGDMLATRMHARTRAMILLGAYEGLRVSEIARIRGEHLDGGELYVLGKGGREDYLPIHPLVADVAEQMPPRGFWFPSHIRPGPIRGNSVSAIISDVMHRAGVRATPHALRHFFGTSIQAEHGDLALTQSLLRHASVATTVIYTRIDTERRRAAVEAIPLPLKLRIVR